jgi:hypothetical protein
MFVGSVQPSAGSADEGLGLQHRRVCACDVDGDGDASQRHHRRVPRSVPEAQPAHTALLEPFEREIKRASKQCVGLLCCQVGWSPRRCVRCGLACTCVCVCASTGPEMDESNDESGSDFDGA